MFPIDVLNSSHGDGVSESRGRPHSTLLYPMRTPQDIYFKETVHDAAFYDLTLPSICGTDCTEYVPSPWLITSGHAVGRALNWYPGSRKVNSKLSCSFSVQCSLLVCFNYFSLFTSRDGEGYPLRSFRPIFARRTA